jgi:YVTN family beta-propeller protein
MLALHPNAPVPADRLMEGLWGEEQPASAPKMVQLYVSQLRKLLDADAAQIVTRGRGYELRVPADAVDAVRFERLVEEAARAEETPNAPAREALALWRGPPLDDVADEPFAAAEIRRLEDLWLRAWELAIDGALAAGEHGAVLGELEELVAAHPLRERLQAQRMLALYRSGRQAEALAAYRHARGVLVTEVGVEPGPELRRLHEQILNQDPALAVPADAHRPAAAPVRSRAARPRRTVAVAAAALAAAGGLAAFGISRLASPDRLERIDGDAVGVIDPDDGRITAQYGLGHAPDAIASGGGSVWVANARDGTVSRIDRGREQVTTIDVGGEPTALAYASGSLWVTDGQNRRLDQVDPTTNRVVHRFAVGNAPRGVTATSDAIWVASPVDGRVDRIDLARGGTTRALALGGGPATLAAGAGAVWVAEEDAGVLTRLEPRSGAALTAIAVGNAPAAVAVGDGAVWVANREDGTVSRIDPATDAVSDTIHVGGSPVGLAVGDGAVWVADGRGATVVRIDPRTRRVTRRVRVEGSPAALVVAEGAVWTAALAPRASHRGGTLRYESSPVVFCGCIDPAGYDGSNWPVIAPVYDGLVSYRRVQGAAGSTPVANLATTIPEPTDRGRTYVFQLRPGLRFSNGKPVRPQDFRASLERALALAPGVRVYAGIVGADACRPHRCDLAMGIETDARARTIAIHLRAPDPEFVHKLALPLASVVPAESPIALATTRPLPGTGPYRIASFDLKRGGRLVRNRYFRSWSAEARPNGFPDEIAVEISSNARAQVAAVRAGKADVIATSGGFGRLIPIADVRALLVAEASRLHAAPSASVDYAFLNVREAPFDDVRVRRALNYAIDRRHVIDLLGGPAVAAPTCQILPPGIPGYEPSCPYTSKRVAGGIGTGPDLARARRLVARSGTGGARIDVWTPPGTDAERVYRYVAGVLRRLGYRARVRVMRDGARYFPFVADSRSRVQIGFTSWLADFLSPSSFLEPNFTCRQLVPGSASNGNLSQFCDRAVDTAVDRAKAALGPEANALWADVDRRVVAAAPAAPLTNRRSVLLVSNRVGNVQQHLLLGPLLDQLWVR